MGNDVVGVATAARAVDERPDLVQQGGGLKPVGILGRQMVDRLQPAKQLHAEIADALRENQVCAVVPGGLREQRRDARTRRAPSWPELAL